MKRLLKNLNDFMWPFRYGPAIAVPVPSPSIFTVGTAPLRSVPGIAPLAVAAKSFILYEAVVLLTVLSAGVVSTVIDA